LGAQLGNLDAKVDRVVESSSAATAKPGISKTSKQSTPFAKRFEEISFLCTIHPPG
jgi:hypothetical protein